MSLPPPPRIPLQAQPPRARPDARPMRLALAGGGIAIFSAIAAAIVLPPQPASPGGLNNAQAADPQATSVQVQRAIRYVQLSPGQTAPPGATVIDAAAPTPMTVVVTITAPPQTTTRTTTVKTSQSGKP